MFVAVIGYIDGHIEVVGPYPNKLRATQEIEVLPIGAYRGHIFPLRIPENVVEEVKWRGERA